AHSGAKQSVLTGHVISSGWLRASHRALDAERSTADRPFHLHQKTEPLVPGKVYRLDIELWPTSYLFKRGHRIALELTASDPPATAQDQRIAGTTTIYHDAPRPSHLL